LFFTVWAELFHELGHALGPGESSDSTSAMYGTLTPATVIRTLTTADLNIPYGEAGVDAQRATVPIPPPAADTATTGLVPVSPAAAVLATRPTGGRGAVLAGARVWLAAGPGEGFSPWRVRASDRSCMRSSPVPAN
jgi:hypothetical protein